MQLPHSVYHWADTLLCFIRHHEHQQALEMRTSHLDLLYPLVFPLFLWASNQFSTRYTLGWGVFKERLFDKKHKRFGG